MSALIFDLDGTLVDSVYEHVHAWHRAFASHEILIPSFEYHKRIGMTGEALVEAVSQAFSLDLTARQQQEIIAKHASAYHERTDDATPLRGIERLWQALDARKITWAIATSAGKDDAQTMVNKIGCPQDVVLITKSDDTSSKPSPDVFERAAARLGVDLDDAMIVGDSVWDMLASRRAGSLGIGVLTGGYGREELVAAGAYRVYRDVVELSQRFIELGL